MTDAGPRPSSAAATADEDRHPAADPVAHDDVVRLARDLIRIDTTNRGGGECRERPAAEYVAEALGAARLDPVLVESAPGRGNVVARVAGSEPDLPAVLVHGHLDVVPARGADWRVDPFAAEITSEASGDVLWGRGAVDMKNMVAMMLATARAWARTDRRPRRDVVFAFTADEEDASTGAAYLVDQHPELFDGCTEGFSESGAYTFHLEDGTRIYPVSAGERGTAWLRLTARGTAGHGSRRVPENAVGNLAAAVAAIDRYEWPVRLTPVVRASIEALAEIVGVDVDLGGSDHDIAASVARLGRAAQLVEPVLRNSANPTMLEAGYKINVIPGEATAYVDGRTVPGGSASFEATLDELTGPNVAWDYYHHEVPVAAPVHGPTFQAMTDALLAFDPGARVVPACMAGSTDAKQFARLGIAGYGFSPLKLPEGYDYRAMFHGVDERVPLSALHFGVDVLDHFLTTVG